MFNTLCQLIASLLERIVNESARAGLIACEWGGMQSIESYTPGVVTRCFILTEIFLLDLIVLEEHSGMKITLL